MDDPSVRDFMTQSPITIESSRSAAAARWLMEKHKIRHLPVVDDGHLAGMVSMRDVAMLHAFLDPSDVRVAEIMRPDPFTVSPDEPLIHAARVMADRRLGSVVVAQGGKVVGIFTTVDALRALANLTPAARVVQAE